MNLLKFTARYQLPQHGALLATQEINVFNGSALDTSALSDFLGRLPQNNVLPDRDKLKFRQGERQALTPVQPAYSCVGWGCELLSLFFFCFFLVKQQGRASFHLVQAFSKREMPYEQERSLAKVDMSHWAD